MKIRYNSMGRVPREIHINFNEIQVISWRYTYNSKREITDLYFVYIDKNTYRTSLYCPVGQLLDKEALFNYLETKLKDKCLER